MMDEPYQSMLGKAHERLRSAKVLIDTGSYADSISRSYYAVLDAARTLLVKNKIYPKSHAGTISKFHEKYIKTGLFPIKYGKTLAAIEKARTEADYEFKVEFTKSEAKERYRQAKEFVDQVKQYFED